MTFLTQTSLTSNLPEFILKKKLKQGTLLKNNEKMVQLDPILNADSFKIKKERTIQPLAVFKPKAKNFRRPKPKLEPYQDEELLQLFGIRKNKVSFINDAKKFLLQTEERLDKAVIDWSRNTGQIEHSQLTYLLKQDLNK